DLSFTPLRPERVLEVAYDHMEGNRFRHTAQFRRWREDRDPASCTYEQLEEPVRYDLTDLPPGAPGVACAQAGTCDACHHRVTAVGPAGRVLVDGQVSRRSGVATVAVLARLHPLGLARHLRVLRRVGEVAQAVLGLVAARELERGLERR